MKLEDYQPVFQHLQTIAPKEYVKILRKQAKQVFSNPTHGNFDRWKKSVETLPRVTTEHRCLNQAMVSIGQQGEITLDQHQLLKENLLALSPWRKGPFNIFGIEIDSEWRSDMKWDRLTNRLPDLRGLTVLDVGCGNGYFLLRMLGAGASCVLGVDPSLLFVAQFQALTQFLELKPCAHILPVPFENISVDYAVFDVIFSMGVLYHRRDPIEHLRQLRRMLHPEGFLVLESIIFNSPEPAVLIPEDRYAGMRNVWQLPSPAQLEQWLHTAGWKEFECISIEPTLSQEQRSTKWMHSYSLANFLDKNNPSLTIEGHPAPVRGIWLARI